MPHLGAVLLPLQAVLQLVVVLVHGVTDLNPYDASKFTVHIDQLDGV